jgi:tRNA pseudouridine13 synthase
VKVKRIPEDFQVEERTAVVPRAEGRFALYRLTKVGIGTMEAVSAVARRWRLPERAIAYGGLKDRHARTRQFVTIERGPPRDLEQENLALEYLGRAERPFTAADVAGNGFRIVLRSLSAGDEAACVRALARVALDGLPNYFDDQRFGSLGHEGVHVAQPWIRGDLEGTLRLGLAGATPMDRPRDREEKRLLRERWGDWEALARGLRPGPRQRIAAFLAARPGDWKGALALVRPDLRSLWLSALQSDLWNRVLAAWLRETVPAADLREMEMKAATLPFPERLSDDARARFHALSLPLPSSRVVVEDAAVRDLVERTLAPLGLTMRALNVKHPRGSFFSKGFRAAALRPQGIAHEAGADEIHPGRRRLSLAFDLPRGAYATILVKRLQLAAAT